MRKVAEISGRHLTPTNLASLELHVPLAGRGEPEKLLTLATDARIRAEKEGDLFRDVLDQKQKLPYL